MDVTFVVTGPDEESVRHVVSERLRILNAEVDWQIRLRLTPAFRWVDGQATVDLIGKVSATHGDPHVEPSVRLLD